MVVDHHVVVAQAARIAKGQDLPVEAAVKDDARVAERAIGDKHGHLTDHVVDDLVEQHDAQGIGTGLTVDLDTQDGLQPVDRRQRLYDAHELRLVDRRKRGPAGAAGEDLAQRHRAPGKIGERKLTVKIEDAVRDGGLLGEDFAAPDQRRERHQSANPPAPSHDTTLAAAPCHSELTMPWARLGDEAQS